MIQQHHFMETNKTLSAPPPVSVEPQQTVCSVAVVPCPPATWTGREAVIRKRQSLAYRCFTSFCHQDSIPVAALVCLVGTLTAGLFLVNVVMNGLLRLLDGFWEMAGIREALSSDVYNALSSALGFLVLPAIALAFFLGGRLARWVAPRSAVWGTLPLLAYFGWQVAQELRLLFTDIGNGPWVEWSPFFGLLLNITALFLIIGAAPPRSRQETMP